MKSQPKITKLGESKFSLGEFILLLYRYVYLCFMKMKKIFTIVIFCFLGSFFQAQNKVASEVQAETSKLKNAVDTKNESAQANSYFNIGESFYNDGNFPKSEEYFLKSKIIYEKLNDNQNLEKVTRKLAQSQEKQKKLISAANNYQKASKVSFSKSKKVMNENDASRLSTPVSYKKAEAIQNNIDISKKSNENEALAESYSQMADVNIEQKDNAKAEENLNNAYEISKKETPNQALATNKKLTDFYVENKNFDKAIEAKKDVLKEDFVKENSQKKVEQIQELADIYIQKNDKEEAISLLKTAYEIALQKGHTLEAQKSVRKLDSLYNLSQNTDASVLLYRDFLVKLPNLVSKDRSLIDKKILEDTELRIYQLESEKKLKDELIRKKNIFNYSLITALVLVLGMVFFIFRTLKKVQIKNKKIALQSLRREMNPHFIFNSLNSVNQFIATNNELEANKYLTKFSKLMRGVMENSTEDFISFQQELDLLQNYLALEKTRFVYKFDYEISVDENLNQQNLQIPGMLIQPFLENAIWHGLRYRNDKGFLKLNFKKENNSLKISIEDNGIGIEESKKQKTHHQKNREGRGMKNTLERIQLLNDLYKKQIICTIKDKENGGGVLVNLSCKIS